MSVDLGLLVLRVLVGLVLAAHGVQKLFGWFGGHGLATAAGPTEKMGFRPGRLWALIAAVSEFGGGLLMALGLLTSLAAVGLVVSMLIAVTKVHWNAGFWGAKGGYEYPLTLLVVSAVLGLTGAGRYSLDALLTHAGFVLPSVPAFLTTFILALIVVGVGLAYGNNASRRSEA